MRWSLSLKAFNRGFGGHNASLVVATFGAQSVIDEPVQDVTAALALGPVLVLPNETPGLTCTGGRF